MTDAGGDGNFAHAFERANRLLTGGSVAEAQDAAMSLIEKLAASEPGAVRDRRMAATWRLQARALHRQGRTDEALPRLETALGLLDDRRSGPDAMVTGNVLSTKAAVLTALGREDEAERARARLFAVYARSGKGVPRTVATELLRSARHLIKEDLYDAAFDRLDTLRELLGGPSGAELPQKLRLDELLLRGECEALTGKLQQSIATYDALFVSAIAAESFDRAADAGLFKSLVLSSMGDEDGALTLLAELANADWASAEDASRAQRRRDVLVAEARDADHPHRQLRRQVVGAQAVARGGAVDDGLKGLDEIIGSTAGEPSLPSRLVLAHALRAKAEILRQAERHEAALAAIAELRDLVGDDPGGEMAGLGAEGQANAVRVLLAAGRQAEACTAMDTMLQMLEKAGEPAERAHHADLALWANEGFGNLKAYAMDARHLERILAQLADAVTPELRAQRARALRDLVMISAGSGLDADAQEAALAVLIAMGADALPPLERTSRRAARGGFDGAPRLAWALILRAQICGELGRTDEALEILDLMPVRVMDGDEAALEPLRTTALELRDELRAAGA